MAKDSLTQQKRYVSIAYVFMFFALMTIVTGLIAYFLAAKVARAEELEVWLQTHSLWIMHNVLLYIVLSAFAALWFIPLLFFPWNAFHWVTGCVIAGIVFGFIAWMYFFNCFIRGMSNYLKHKPVF
ncbi:hypothetical protein [Acinetobacter sp. MD2(2019)]|uniref:hypothetical protein n=1 Tax=Acinetobacter sp. MD2(2019) TaxID=2605273 RepID=UPI002D1EFD5B|nr:hypothetical protein [Acinetobacter sp. MD2(2019)]MEB3754471.1 hypothetical protein [Acinetobacter sp. MD2(2019)]